MSAREWEPGDRAYIEVEVRGIERAYAEVRIVGPGTDEGLAYPPLADLRPVPAAGGAATAVLEAIEDDGNDPERPTHPERIAGWRACADAVREALDAVREAATEDVVERAVRVLAESSGLDWRLVGDDFRESFRRHARALTAAGLLAGVPGRSEAEIKAEALREAADAWETDDTDPTPRSGANTDGWLRRRAARVAGPTEAGDES